MGIQVRTPTGIITYEDGVAVDFHPYNFHLAGEVPSGEEIKKERESSPNIIRSLSEEES